MGFLLHRRFIGLVILGLLVFGLAGCTPDASADIISPKLGAQLAAEEAGAQVKVQPTPTPLTIAAMSKAQILAGLPADVAKDMAAAKPDQGKALTVANGCIGCHSLDPNQKMTGPTWHNVADAAANLQPGQSPALYFYTSITDPNAFVVPGFPANVMPQNFKEKLSAQDLADIISYLLQQHS